MARTTKTFTVEVTYDDEKADEEGIARALDILMETVTSTPGILDDYGEVTVGDFYYYVDDEGY